MEEQKNLDIIFMGTPEFAVESLREIVKEGYSVKAVVTAPDRPAGRGRKLNQSAVKKFALNQDIPVLQPTNLKDPSFVEQIKGYEADLFIVVAFRMLPQIVWEIPRKGTFNLHGSLLPEYRGAAPINWAVINGEKETGVTTFFIDQKIDTGGILLQEKLSIGENETAGELHDRMMVAGAKLVVQTIKKISNDEITPQPQNVLPMHSAPKIYKQDCQIDFRLPATRIHDFIRGMSPYPTAWIRLRNNENRKEKTLKIFRSKIVPTNHIQNKIQLKEEEGRLYLYLEKGKLEIEELQLEGKKRMESKAFLAGFSPEKWTIVDNKT